MKIASTIQSTGGKNGNYQCEMEKWQSEWYAGTLASQGKANVNPEGEDSAGKSKLSVTGIPEAEDYSQEWDDEMFSEIVNKKMPKRQACQ